MSKNVFLKNEHEAWDSLRGPRNANIRRRYWRIFKKTFPQMHNASLLPIITELVSKKSRETLLKDYRAKYLRNISPRAYNLLEIHGRDYKPKFYAKPPGFGEPEPRKCSSNSCYVMYGHNSELEPERTPIVYVEGITMGVKCWPMLHAWNARGLESDIAIDWTFYATSQWNRYLGIALTEEEHGLLQRTLHPRKPRPLLLLHRSNFPRIESQLTKILEGRA